MQDLKGEKLLSNIKKTTMVMNLNSPTKWTPWRFVKFQTARGNAICCWLESHHLCCLWHLPKKERLLNGGFQHGCEMRLAEKMSGWLPLRMLWTFSSNSLSVFQTTPRMNSKQDLLKLENVNLVNKTKNDPCYVWKSPHSVTGNYRVEDWRASQGKWPQLDECVFPLPANDGFVGRGW